MSYDSVMNILIRSYYSNVRANFSKVSNFMHILYGNLLIFEKFALTLQYLYVSLLPWILIITSIYLFYYNVTRYTLSSHKTTKFKLRLIFTNNLI
jgi:hypothetical protein